jgi:hypothetical protein
MCSVMVASVLRAPLRGKRIPVVRRQGRLYASSRVVGDPRSEDVTAF